MSAHSFAVSLNPNIHVTSTKDQYTVYSSESELTPLLNLVKTPGIDLAFDHLQKGNTTTASLLQGLTKLDGQEVGEQFALTLQQLREKGLLDYAVLPLAVATPMVDSAELNLSEPYWTKTSVALCRFAYQHSYQGTMVLESPLSKFRVKLLDWRASAILAQLAQPQTLGTLTPPSSLGAETAYQFLNLLWAAGFLTADSESPSLQLWDFHNLLFHSRTRDGRHDYLLAEDDLDKWSDFPMVKPPMSEQIISLPRPNLGALKCNDATLTEAIETRKSIRQSDDSNPITITQLGELLYRTARVKQIISPEDKLSSVYGQNWRENKAYLENHAADFDYGELSLRPYPAAGGMYEFELYPVVRLCEGLNQGIYHYDPLNHQLEKIERAQDDIHATDDIHITLGYGVDDFWFHPQVLLVITARFGRLFRRYRSMGYAALLKSVGVLYQNFYLVATNMGLAPGGWGRGDSDIFGQAVGLNYLQESSVGEFTLGSLPKSNVKASGLESMEVDGSEATAKAINSANKVEFAGLEAESESTEAAMLASKVEPSELAGETETTEVRKVTEDSSVQVEESEAEAIDSDASDLLTETPDTSDSTAESVEISALSESTSEPAVLEAENGEVDVSDLLTETPDTSGSTAESVEISALSESTSEPAVLEAENGEMEADVVESEIESESVLESEVESSAISMPLSLHPHELDDRIPGLAELHNQTLGDPRITIVILDGDPDHTLSCFEGAEVSKVLPYWHEPAEPINPEDYATFQDIRDQGLKGQEKEDALNAAIPETKNRIELNDHACHVTSNIVGQEHSPVFGIAPNCRVINMPLDAVVTPDHGVPLGGYSDVLSPLNLARAIEYAIELDANVIHCAFCRPTQTSEGEEILVKALKKCQDNNILVVAPTGNNSNESWCLPAVLSGTLAVGAATADGTPTHFSNWGGNNTKEGIIAPGEDILGAQPGTEEPVSLTGTSMAAPLITGISALLMSLQLQEGKPMDAEAVRAALIKTATPCDPEAVEETESCLQGLVNVSGAMKMLFGHPSVTISFAGDQVTRKERAGYERLSSTSIEAAETSPPNAAPGSIEAAMMDNPNATSSELSGTSNTAVTESIDPANVKASTAFSGHVYAHGTLGYDFGDEARRDSFKQLMPPTELNGIMVPADPYDAHQMVNYLEGNPDEARSLSWTLNLEADTLYVLEPKGPFSLDVYEMLLQLLAGQLEPETSDGFVERISVGARRTYRTVELFSGEIVPVVTVYDIRGMYGWTVNALINSALASIANLEPEQEPIVRENIEAFLNRVYYDLHNLGQTSHDRALNFSATNIFQATTVFAEAIADDRRLDTITVKKSPYCRIHSDCWDVLLTFFDPENGRRSRQVFRFTLDVARNMPVTIGTIKRWAIPGKLSGYAS